MENKVYNILILGAYDRFNYGDLLFPYVIESSLQSRLTNVKFHYYGLRKSDLSLYGGKPTKSIREFYKDCRKLPNTIVIIAGGESIRIPWVTLFSFYNAFFMFLSRFKKYFNIEKYVKWYLGAKTELPFTFSKNQVGTKLVLFNSLGESGACLDAVVTDERLRCLKDVDYFAVRENATYNAFNSFDNVQLYPDSAILMSECFTASFLKNNLSKKIQDFIDEKQNQYLFFQINKYDSKGNEKMLANLFQQIYDESGLCACFCPIGKAYGHEDHFALKNIIKEMKSPYTFFEDVCIWEIMSLIANAKIYVGTSLHGIITSMSFKVPYIGVGEPKGKVYEYIQTWGNKEDHCLSINSELFVDDLLTIINKKEANINAIESIRKIQIDKANESFDNMSTLISKQ